MKSTEVEFFAGKFMYLCFLSFLFRCVFCINDFYFDAFFIAIDMNKIRLLRYNKLFNYSDAISLTNDQNDFYMNSYKKKLNLI